MSDVTRGLSASEAAMRLGVSAKALRLYGGHARANGGRIPRLRPGRSGTCGRSRGASRARLGQLGRERAGRRRPQPERRLAMHEAALGRDIQDLVGKVDKVRAIAPILPAAACPTTAN